MSRLVLLRPDPASLALLAEEVRSAAEVWPELAGRGPLAPGQLVLTWPAGLAAEPGCPLDQTLLLVPEGPEPRLQTWLAEGLWDHLPFPVSPPVLRQRLSRWTALDTLTRAEEQYRRFFMQDLTGDALIEASGRVRLFNPAFARMFDVPGDSPSLHWDQFHPEHPWSTLTLPEAGDPALMLEDWSGRSLSGRPLQVSGALSPVLNRGERTFHGFFLDVTRRKRVEAQLAQTQKMEALGRLAGGIAHDFNNLMTAILGFSELLHERLTDEQDREDVQEIIQTAEKGTRMIRQLLALGRKPLKPVLEPIILDDLLRGLMPLVAQWTKEGVRVEWDLDSPGVSLRANRQDLGQAVLNLLFNARDALGRAGGLIRVSTSRLEPYSPDLLVRPELGPVPHLALRVSDTGEGIDAALLPFIFEPFFSTKDEEEGSGVGLALVHNTVKAAGGSVDVQSTPGIGSDFRLFFPLEAPVDEAPPPRGLLLIEPDAREAWRLQGLLETEGHRVWIVPDLEAAQQVSRSLRSPIDLVLLDSRWDSQAWLDRVRQMHRNLRVLYLHEGPGPAGWDRLSRPFSDEALTSRIRRLLEGVVLAP